MSETEKRGGSRGLSLITGVFLIAVAGSVVMAFKLAPHGSSLSQPAAVSQSIVDRDTPDATGQNNATTVTDDIRPKSLQVNGTMYTVYYACKQVANDPANSTALKQNCQPGFIYSMNEINGKLFVTPAAVGEQCSGALPDADTLCTSADPNDRVPVKSCPTDPNTVGSVKYSLFVKSAVRSQNGSSNCSAGKPIDLRQARLSGISDILKSAPAQEQQDILSTTNVPTTQFGAIKDAFQKETLLQGQAEAVAKQQTDTASKLAALSDCPGYDACAADKKALQDKAVALAQEQKDLQTQLQSLKDNEVKMMAGENPSESTASSGQQPPGTPPYPAPQDGSTFQQIADQKDQQNVSKIDTGSLWSKAKNLASNIGSGVAKASCEFIGIGCSAQAGYDENAVTVPDTSKDSAVADTTSIPFDQARADAAQTARLNGLVAQTLYTELQKNPDEKVRNQAIDIVNATKGNTALQTSYLNTLATAARQPVPAETAVQAALSSAESEKLHVQEAIITSKQCAPGSKSIFDCFKAAGLQYTLDTRKQVAADLGLNCGKIGTAAGNICMFKAVQDFNQKATITTTSNNLTVTVDPTDGHIIGEPTVEPHTSTVSAGPVPWGGTQAQVDQFKSALENNKNLVKAGDIVYQTELPAQDVTVRCIDSLGESIQNPACTTYTKAIPSTSLQSKNLSGLFSEIQDTKSNTATTKYVLADQIRTMDVDGSIKWTVDGSGTEFNTALLQRKSTEGGIQSLAVPYDQLPVSVQAQLTPPGKSQPPTYATQQAQVPYGPLPANTAPVESQYLASLYDQARVDAAMTARWEGLAAYTRQQQQLLAEEVAQQNEAVRLQAWTSYDQKVQDQLAQERAQAFETVRLQAQSSYDQQVQDQIAVRTTYLQNSRTTQDIYDALHATGQAPADTSAYINKLVTLGAYNSTSQAQMDAYLQNNYNKIVKYGASVMDPKSTTLEGILATIPPPVQVQSQSDIYDRSKDSAFDVTASPLQQAGQKIADLASDLTGKDLVVFGVQGHQSASIENPQTSGIALPDTPPLPGQQVTLRTSDGSTVSLAPLPRSDSGAISRLVPSAPSQMTLDDVDRAQTIAKAVVKYGSDSVQAKLVEKAVHDPFVQNIGDLRGGLSAYDIAPVPTQQFSATDRTIPVSSGVVTHMNGMCWLFTTDCTTINQPPTEQKIVFTLSSDRKETLYKIPGTIFTKQGTVGQNLLPSNASGVSIARQQDGVIQVVVVGGIRRGVYTIPNPDPSITNAQILAGLSGQTLK